MALRFLLPFFIVLFLTGSVPRPETRIAGGIVVPEGSVYFKFAVQTIIYINETAAKLCGGSLISPSYIITAGYCVGYPMSNLCNL